ncbi:MAG: lactonase family protein [Acidobacteria bacterium]|nr:lactonase family protein [Acidobacteriota bacterium]
MDTTTGRLTALGLAAETVNPSFVAIHPNRKYLYAVSEIANYNGAKSGAVGAFQIDAKTGRLAPLNKMPSRGAGPCFVAVDRTGKDVLVTNYGSGSVAVLPIQPNGSVGEATAFIQHTGSSVNPKRQSGPHAHSVNMSPDNRFAIAADLGLDKLMVYRFNPAKGSLEANDPPFATVPPGSGPRHFAFHPNGKFAYAINELASTVTAFSWDAAHGALKQLQNISTLPKDFTGASTCAEVQVHPNGRFLYGSNRGHDSIAVFEINPKTGALTWIENVSTQGKTPRNFGIDPTGAFLLAANQDTDNITVFRIDPGNGRLKPTGQTLGVGRPVCVKFMAVK